MASRRRWFPAALATGLVLAGCSLEGLNPPAAPEPLPEPPGQLIRADTQRITTPSAPAEDLASVVTGNTDFGAALYRQAAQPGGNLFFSPLSITQALAMTYAGARGTTETQMAQALRFALPQEKLHPALNALDLALDSRSQGSEARPVPLPELNTVNAVWVQQGLAFEPAFLDVLAQHHDAGVRAVDFVQESEKLRGDINAWISGQTRGRIRDLLPPNALRSDTSLVLTNALYFKGSWATPFVPTRTSGAPFQLLGGGEQQVQMMRAIGAFPHMKGEGFEAVSLPYVGGAFRMLVILPELSRFAEVESRLSAAFLDTVRAGLAGRHMDLGFPKFQVEQQLPLVEPLTALGMGSAFTASADLSGMTRAVELVLTDARHKAFVAVDEKGTEAAAATEVVAGPVSLPEPFTVNRPFLFLIEDVDTKAVLFLGRVVKP
jgi:serpin B